MSDLTQHDDPVLSTYCNWKNWDVQRFGKFTAQDAAYYEAELGSRLGSSPKAVVLEIGFGNGAFLGWCKARGFDCSGVEQIPELISKAQEQGFKTYESIHDSLLRLRQGQFDCIVAFDVLEHIEQKELPGYFQRVAMLLKPGGYFIARFPNGDSPFGRMYQHGDLAHVATLGQFKIRQLATLAALHVVSIGRGATPSKSLPMTERIRLALGMAIRSAIERFIAQLYFGGLRVCLSPNLVSVLQKPV